MKGSLQEKNGRYYMVLELGGRKQKWKFTGLPVKGNKRRAEEMLKTYLREYEDKLAAAPRNDISMPDLVKEWLKVKKREIRANT